MARDDQPPAGGGPRAAPGPARFDREEKTVTPASCARLGAAGRPAPEGLR